MIRHIATKISGLILLIALATPGFAQNALSLPRADGALTPALHYPAKGAANAPILVLSHGFGGSENGLADLARDTADAGFDTYVLGHAESGRAALGAVMAADDRMAALTKGVTTPRPNQLRLMDLSALIDHLGPRFDTAPLRVLGGHSMGAQLTMIEAGAKTKINVAGENRFDAYIALSFQGPGHVFTKDAWAGITAPVLMLTGTLDRALTGAWTTRLPAYENLPNGQATLAVIQNARHRDLSGKGKGLPAVTSRAIVVDYLAQLSSDGHQKLTGRAGVEITTK
jgi:predicted dienelactone hydrolase